MKQYKVVKVDVVNVNTGSKTLNDLATSKEGWTIVPGSVVPGNISIICIMEREVEEGTMTLPEPAPKRRTGRIVENVPA